MRSLVYDEIQPCNCEIPMMLPYTSSFLGIPIGTTILCCYCRRKITRLTKNQAIKAWNKEVTK
jgi:hypothetical protein